MGRIGMEGGRAAGGAQSVDRALRLLSAVAEAGEEGAALRLLAARCNLNKATCRRLLLSLIGEEWVEQAASTEHYHLGRAAYLIGEMAAPRFKLIERLKDCVARLAALTEDTCLLTVRQGSFAVVMTRIEGTYPIRLHTVQPGQRFPLGVGAASLAMLSRLDEAEADEILLMNEPIIIRKFPGLRLDIMRQQVRDARRKGYSLNKGFIFSHSWGVAVPVELPNGRALGAITVTAIDHRMTDDRIKYVYETVCREIDHSYVANGQAH